MGPTAPAPLTRAAARKTAPAFVDRSDTRARLLHVLALSGGAFAGAFIVLWIGGLVGIPSIDSPSRPASDTEQIAVPAPRPATASPTPRSTPSADPTPSDEAAAPVSPEVVAPATPVDPAPVLAPEPSEPSPEPVVADPPTETGPGKSASAPGRNKPPVNP